VKKIALLTLGAALIATPAIAAQRGPADAKPTLTRAEAQTRAAEMFAKLDANKDGKLDAADRAARRTAMQAKRFEALDANKDGSVSKAEWDQHAAKRGEKRAAAGEARDGKRHAMRGPGKRGGHRMGGGMKPGGAGDKVITQAEFVAAALARFDRLDANKDGQVTTEERQAARTAWKAKAEERRAQRGAAPATK
jgi:Ca2+-binding EF-hand superfamily protein